MDGTDLPCYIRWLISTSWRKTNSRSLQGAYQRNGGQPEKSGADVVMDAGEESGSGAESGWSGVSNNSSTNSECNHLRGLVSGL